MKRYNSRKKQIIELKDMVKDLNDMIDTINKELWGIKHPTSISVGDSCRSKDTGEVMIVISERIYTPFLRGYIREFTLFSKKSGFNSEEEENLIYFKPKD